MLHRTAPKGIHPSPRPPIDFSEGGPGERGDEWESPPVFRELATRAPSGNLDRPRRRRLRGVVAGYAEMGLQSLREKLLQAGLIDEEQAKRAEAEAAAERRRAAQKRRESSPRSGRPKEEARKAQPLTEEERRAREEELAFRQRQRELEREREENRRRAQEDRKRMEALRAIAEKHEITERGDEPFFFVSRKKKLLRMYLTRAQIEALERGELAIIDKPTPAELVQALVPRAAAEEALTVDPRAIRFYNRGNGETYGFVSESNSGA